MMIEVLDEGVDHASIVRAMYLGLLGREPDPNGLAYNITRAHEIGIAALMDEFVHSDEFKMKAMKPQDHHNLAPRLQIELDAPEADLKRLWNHVSKTWSTLGTTDPYWSVLTDEAFRMGHMTDAEAIDTFYDTGANEIRYFDAFLARNGLKLSPNSVVAEYGCGVGRVTKALAKKYFRILAFDISQPHITSGKSYLDSKEITNVDFYHVRDESFLESLPAFDIFFSVMVLQHNPPPLIMEILKSFFERLTPGGIAFFQVPTYAPGYNFSTRSYLENSSNSTEMEMHFVRQCDILSAARECGLTPLEILPDHYVGNDNWMSTTFLLSKPT